ncbi:MAG: hypothetical protein ACK5LX_09955 [Oscillospiraceae bacterium]
MEYFCEFCGKPLEDGLPCECFDARARRREENTSPGSWTSYVPGSSPMPIDTGVSPVESGDLSELLDMLPDALPEEEPELEPENTEPDLSEEEMEAVWTAISRPSSEVVPAADHVPSQEADIPPSPTPTSAPKWEKPREYQPSPKPKEKKTKAVPTGPKQPDQVTETLREMSGTVAGLAKNPVSAASHFQRLSLPAALSLLALQLLLFPFLCTAIYSSIVKTVSASTGFTPVFSASVFFLPLLWGILSAVIFFAALFAMCKLCRSRIRAGDLLRLTAFSSIPWSACYILLLILALTAGVANTYSIFFSILLVTFTAAFSTLLSEISLRQAIPRDISRIAALAVSVALQMSLVFVLAASQMFQGLMSMLDLIF